jgi:hypothetical protein
VQRLAASLQVVIGGRSWNLGGNWISEVYEELIEEKIRDLTNMEKLNTPVSSTLILRVLT